MTGVLRASASQRIRWALARELQAESDDAIANLREFCALLDGENRIDSVVECNVKGDLIGVFRTVHIAAAK